MVKLPKNNGITELNSNIRAQAIQSLLRMKFKIYGDFRTLYNFMNHYKQASHMSIICLHYYKFCHTVLKSDSSTTKVRVVFDASAKTQVNSCLQIVHSPSDMLCKQILFWFRAHKVVFYNFNAKKYREVIVYKGIIIFRAYSGSQNIISALCSTHIKFTLMQPTHTHDLSLFRQAKTNIFNTWQGTYFKNKFFTIKCN